MTTSSVIVPRENTGQRHHARRNRGEATGTRRTRQVADIPSIISIHAASIIVIAPQYLTPQVEHTHYREWLAEGRSIGSGMVEGACKTAIGKRLKQTGARWRVRRLERMVALCCLVYSEQFDAYWKKNAG